MMDSKKQRTYYKATNGVRNGKRIDRDLKTTGYLSYAQVCLSLDVTIRTIKNFTRCYLTKAEIEPLSYMRQMSLLTHSQN